MEVTLKLDWPNHQHIFKQSTRTTDHYCDYEINHCTLCDMAADDSGIPENRHYEHPKGCKCYWCIYCRCSKLEEREKS
jgi:hypothetical protein